MSTTPAPVRTAVIPAAGFGTRLLPATKAVPKEMLPVIDKPVIQYVVEEALASGIERLIFVVSEQKQALRDHLADDPELEAFLRGAGKDDLVATVHGIAGGARVEYVMQEEQLGLGDAVRRAREAVGDEPFAVMLGDTIIEPHPGASAGLRQVIDAVEAHGGSAVSVRRVPREAVSRYGVVEGEPLADRDAIYRLRRLVEKPAPDEAPSDLAIAGRYVFEPTIFDELADAATGHGGEIQLTDAMNRLAARRPMHAVLWRATRYDIGNRTDYVACIAQLALRDGQIAPTLRRIFESQQSPAPRRP